MEICSHQLMGLFPLFCGFVPTILWVCSLFWRGSSSVCKIMGAIISQRTGVHLRSDLGILFMKIEKVHPFEVNIIRSIDSFAKGCIFKQRYFEGGAEAYYSNSDLWLMGTKSEISRRGIALGGIVAAGISAMESSLATKPVQGLERLPYKPEGYNFWTWRDRKIHYVVQGEGPPIVLIHGFGASAFHWRYNIPELAKKYKVYAVDLLGFGWSEKAIIDYDAVVWRDQVVDFLNEIVKEPAVVVGNSLGGFTALAVAATLPEKVIGLVLLNSAGQFGDPNAKPDESQDSFLQQRIVKPVKEVFQRVVLGFLFWQSKQPARVQSVLKSVYINSSNVDDYLVESITQPASDPNAGEVYYRLMSRFVSNQTKYTLNSLLSQMSCPLLLLWGDLDPWVGPTKAVKIKEFYPNTTVVNLQAGHCPHDEVPELVNSALLDWLSNLKIGASDPNSL